MVDEWKFATTMYGAQYAETFLIPVMLKWYAGSLDCHLKVIMWCNFAWLNYNIFFTDAAVLTYGLSRGTGVIWLDDVQCAGNEAKLIDCPANQLGFTNCGHSRDVGVTCSATNCTHGDIRLSNPGRNYGRVEVCISNIWGVVCADSWSTPDLQVSCRQLGLPIISM